MKMEELKLIAYILMFLLFSSAIICQTNSYISFRSPSVYYLDVDYGEGEVTVRYMYKGKMPEDSLRVYSYPHEQFLLNPYEFEITFINSQQYSILKTSDRLIDLKKFPKGFLVFTVRGRNYIIERL